MVREGYEMSIDVTKLTDHDYVEIYEAIICKLIRGYTKIPKDKLQHIKIGLVDLDKQTASSQSPIDLSTWFDIDPLIHSNKSKYLMTSLQIDYMEEVREFRHRHKDLQRD